MPDNVDNLYEFVGSTWRSCSFLSISLCNLLSRHCRDLVGFPFKSSYTNIAEAVRINFIEGRKRDNSTPVSTMNLIDISSDSDLMIDDDEDFDFDFDSSPVRSSADSRKLPSWAVTADTNARSYGGQTQKATSPKRTNGTNGSASNWHTSQADDSLHLIENGNAGLPRTVNSRIANVSGRDYEKLSSQQAFKRTLPPSLHRSPISSKSNNLGEGASSSHTRDIYGNTYHPAVPSSSHGKGYMRDTYGRGNYEESMMYENNGSRTLPSSLMHGKSTPFGQFGSSDPSYRPMAGEEGVAGSDERLIYQAALEELNQPKVEANLPDGLLSVPLLRHQKIALAWMIQKETRSLHCLGGILADDQGLGKTVSMIALIQLQKALQRKSKPEDQSNKKSEALNLDDDDENDRPGLDEVKQSRDSDDIKPVPGNNIKRRRPAAGTLVVCPASILRQWAGELRDKVADEAQLSYLIYHGGTRTKDPVEVAKYDVILTTYAIVTNEVPKQPMVNEDEADEKDGEKFGVSSEFAINKKRKNTATANKKRKKGRNGMDGCSNDYDSGPLARVSWSRVILDEAQTIKNHRTQVARACCSLRAKTRWCLSGTPIQNAVDDLYSYFRFLRYEPYALYKSFYTTIKVPISRNSIQGYKKLQAVLRAVMLRRTKGTLIDGEPIVKLPPKTICLTKVDFSAEERAFYTRLEADSRSKFKAYAAAGTLNQNYANILLMLLRLRQACDHPLLVKGINSDSFGKDSVDMAKRLPHDMVINLLDCLESSLAICHVCNDPPENPVVTMCSHVFCYQCVSEHLTGDDNTCPANGCKEQLGSDVVFSEATLISCMSDKIDAGPKHTGFDDRSMVLQNDYSSSKIRAVIEILQSHLRSPSPELDGSAGCNGPPTAGPKKTIIFSQWTSMLDLVEFSLNQFCIQYRRLDGTMSLAARDRAVKDFNNDPEVTVMIMSLKAGNLGLNMVAACHVILLDLWWNPTTEDQAIDRAHRIGQTRPVTVTRLTVKDTVEDRILALQEEKRRMVASAFGEDGSGGTVTRLTPEDLKYLFMGHSA
ncbi:helicase-like transcription factor CHR28 isoform X2 [Mercurialis annua]|uniref:helicase-like transcription factor CHR28 isoform X2 n=1 Tax=Mercurialis annua TaxID=3986 RepID=UPI0021601FCD|nr:helicase-like transcription factor CHR28 isoform X2 [Mercurialis annua]